MFDSYVPPNWFWILIAIAITCYIKLAGDRLMIPTPRPNVSPASIISILW